MLHDFIDLLLRLTESWGYFGIFVLMTIESSFVPFPSEVVIPPAAALAYQGKMEILPIIFFGTLGSLAGAILNYYLAIWIGRPIIYKFVESKCAKFFLLSKDKVLKAEDYFRKRGVISTFIGRLIPVVRQLISIPAGFVRMDFVKFCFYTTLGAGIWVSFLALQGWLIAKNSEYLLSIFENYGVWIWTSLGLIFLFWLVRKRLSR